MSSAVDSPAPTSHPLAAGEELPQEILNYGSRCCELLKRCAPALSLLKIAQTCALVDLDISSRDFPTWGIVLNGACWGLDILEDRTKETECGYWPTLTANDAKNVAGPGQFKRNTWPLNAEITTIPAWIPCDCGEFLCTIHMCHAFECRCKPIEEWSTDPYSDRVPGQLAPKFSEWLMGWPIGWTDLKPLGMDKFQQWLRLHGEC